LEKSTSYEAPDYAVFSNLPSLHLSFLSHIFHVYALFRTRLLISNQYKNAGNVVVYNIVIFKYLDWKLEPVAEF
jgi:hypothetical protein